MPGASGIGHDDGHRLSSLESSLLGHEREGDVPGFEIPARYFHYVRTGDARPLAAVLEHNRLDLLSLALLTARAAQLLDEGVTRRDGTRGARDRPVVRAVGDDLRCFSLLMRERLRWGRTCARTRSTRTRCCCGVSAATRRRQTRGSACSISATAPRALEREAAEALAVHHEHRLRSLISARHLAMRSLQLDATSLTARGHRASSRAARPQAGARRASTPRSFE